MRTSKKIVSLVLAVLMVVSMMSVMAVSASAADYVASDVNYQYTDLNQAYYWAEDGGTVTLADDYTTDYIMFGYDISKAVTFDLGGHTLTLTSYDNQGTAIYQYDNSNITFKNGTIKFTSNAGATATAYYAEKGTINLDKTLNVVCEGNTIALYVAGPVTLNTAANITTNEGFCITGNGSAGKDGYEINVTGGKITNNNGMAIYSPNNGTLNISGGTITGDTAVYVKCGTVNISKGTLNGTGTDTEYTFNGNGCNSTGDALVIDNCGYPGGAPVVNITGGTFNSTNADAVGTYVKNDSFTEVEPTITGGTFSSDVSAYVDYSDVMWEYTSPQGKVTYYKTNPTGGCSNGTYKLMKDITVASYITTVIFGTDVTIDLNSHTYTSTHAKYAVYMSRNNSGSLNYSMTIKNGTINYTNASSDYAAVQAQGKGNTLVLDNVTINSAVAGVAVLSENQNVTINDSTITATDDFALATNGSKTKNGTITVNNSTLTSNDVAIYLPGDADVTLDNATVSGTTALYVKGGNVDVKGGSYTGTGDHADYSYNGSGCNPTGDAIVVENAGSAYPANNVTISDDAALAVTGNGTYALGAYTKEAEDAVEVALDNVTVPSAYGVGEATFTFANGAAITSAGTPEGWELVDNGNGTATVVYAPLNPLEKAAADINDGNLFGINCDYLKGTLLGVQKKSVAGEDTSSQEVEGGKNIRFVAVLDKEILDAADDYGFVLAKVGSTRTYNDTNIEGLKANWGNGEKTISAKGTSNNVCGNEAYGDPEDTSTSYKYVTCAVNGVDDSSKVVARFYVTIGGTTYYAKYAGQNYQYTGCMAAWSDLG